MKYKYEGSSIYKLLCAVDFVIFVIQRIQNIRFGGKSICHTLAEFRSHDIKNVKFAIFRVTQGCSNFRPLMAITVCSHKNYAKQNSNTHNLGIHCKINQ